MKRALQERLFEFRVVRWAAAVVFLCRGVWFLLLGRQHRGLNDVCWVVRIAGVRLPGRLAGKIVFDAIDSIRRTRRNPLVSAYLADPAASALASTYTLSGNGSHDLFRDLIILKTSTSAEKGVILLKYARTFSAVVACLDLPRLMEHYTFVLEPCWAGYCDPSILMFIAPGHPVLVQCFTDDDCRYIERIGAPLVPIRLGPADWVDADIFKTPSSARAKTYDLVMVANWGAHKRHVQLFRALREVHDREVRVLLIGFAWANRTAEDIRREAAAYVHDGVEIEIVENVPQRNLADYVSQCKVFVFLSRKEGDNKALVEAMFANVPAIVFDKTIGGAGSRINAATGVFASDDELAERIQYMLDHYTEFTPRKWALEHTGSAVATRLLNQVLRRVALSQGCKYSVDIVEKTNAPNLTYKDAGRRADFERDYEFVRACSRYAVPEQVRLVSNG